MDAKGLDPLMRYQEYAEFQFATDGEGAGLRAARHALSAALASSPEVRELDAMVVETALVAEDINPALLADDPDQPLSAWWWHLGKLRQRTYPARLLPGHLQSIYRQDESQAA